MRKHVPGVVAGLAWAGLALAAPVATNNARLGTDVSSAVRTVAASPARVVSLGDVAGGVLFDARIAGIPGRAALDAVLVTGGRVVFSTDVDGRVGSNVFADEDLLVWDGGSNAPGLLWDGSAHGVPAGADVDAAAFEGASTNLLLSFDTTVSLPGGLMVTDDDVVRFAAGAFTRAWSGAADLGLPEGVDLDALHHDGTNLFFSLDRSCTIGTNTAADHDVWRFNTVTRQLAVVVGLGVEARADLVLLDAPSDRDGDGLTDLEELSGRDEPSTVWPGTATALNPGGFTSDPGLADTDGDGIADGGEALAGTDPRSAADVLRVTAIRPAGGTVHQVSWASVAGRTYVLARATNLVAGLTNDVAAVAAAPATNRTTSTLTNAAKALFYRVRVVP